MSEGLIIPLKAPQVSAIERPAAYEMLCDQDANEQVWLAWRLTGIGASEISTVLGINKWNSALGLYAEKIGELPPLDLSDNEAVWWGKELEPLVVKRYKKMTGRGVQPAHWLLRSKEHPWALCTLDAWLLDSEGPMIDFKAPLELKTTSAFKAEEWADGPPEIYYAQVQQQLLVTGYPFASIACLLGGQKLVWCDVQRDEQYIRKIIYQGARFWQQVQDRTPPEPDSSRASLEALNRLYATPTEQIVELPADLQDEVDVLMNLKEAKKNAEESITGIENKIKAALGNASVGYFPDRSGFSWKLQRRPEHTVKASEFRQLRYLKVKED